MKKLLLLGAGFLGAASIYAQTISHSVIASGGGDSTLASQGLSVSWTIGEPVIGTLVSNDQTIILTQGFQQGSLKGVVIVVPVAFSPEISVYPNPISNFINIRIENAEQEILSMRITDLKGNLVASHDKIKPDQLITINAANLSSGVYIIQFFKDRQLLKSVQMVKQ